MPDRELHLLLDGLGFGEGLRWHDGRLWFSDFLRAQVASVGLDGAVRVECTLDDRPSGLGWLPDGRLLVVSMRRRAVLVRQPDGSLAEHADLSLIATSDANDMVVAADGTAYVGNFGSDLLRGEALRPARLALVRPDGTVEAAAADLMFPNGSVITADGSQLIVGESLARRYRAFPIGPGGALGAGAVWAELGDRSPDGCALDAEGAIWFANAAGKEVVRVREGGAVVEVVPTPDTAYACALGGADGRTLFVATAATMPSDDAPLGTGQIWTAGVDVPHAGRP